MPIESTMTCNCGCGNHVKQSESGGGFILKQNSTDGRRFENTPKLEDPACFATLECLRKWSHRAARIGTELLEAVRTGPQPRGTRYDNRMPELTI